MFVWIEYDTPEVGPWVGEKIDGKWYGRMFGGANDTWDFDNDIVCDERNLRECEEKYTVTYIDEDHPRYGELCAMAMKAALTERN